ncbi:MAG: hypothetical protein ACLTD0_03855 [Coprococcus comes]|jgi:hypothetical protein
MKAVKKKLWTGWIRIQKILTEKDGISTVELILVLVENLALYIEYIEGEKNLKNKLYTRYTQEHGQLKLSKKGK